MGPAGVASRREKGVPAVRRRFVYVILGSVALNLALMSIMFVRMREEPKCDVSTRGLAIQLSHPAHWVTVQAPLKGSELPPCRGNVSQLQ